MKAVEQSLQFGNRECHLWRQENFWGPLSTLAEDLAAGFIHVANRHGNAAGNRWLRRNASDLVEPTQTYRRFQPIAKDLEQGFRALVQRAPTTIQGLHDGCAWLASVEERLSIGAFNCTHDDDALINHAEAQARAIDDERNRLISGIAEHNRRQRLGLLPPPMKLKRISGNSLSAQHRAMARLIAEARNPLTPPPGGIPLMAVFKWQPAPKMSLAVANEMALNKARVRARLHGITPPPVNGPADIQLARLTCSNWWRRKLRRLAGRRLEQVQREAHRVHKRAGIYCSDMTIERRRQQKVRNRALLETLEAINQEGQTYTLAELAELGLANPDHRRAELMLRIRDTEVEARRLGHVGMFYTVTTPSRFHPVIARSCHRNPKYNGATPRDAQQHLQQLWAKVRARLAREEVGVYGIRVVEPHHDGTPHWHMLVWMKPEAEATVTATLREYAEEADPEELFDRWGKTNARFDAKRIDYTKGTAAGYVAKYISKNINGQQFMDADNYGRDMNDSAPRIEAWAAVWGVRQFQFFGLPSVTVWREIRRLNEQQDDHVADWEAATRPDLSASERFHAIRKVANAGQWDLFLRLMGGPNLPRNQRPVKPWTVQRMDTSRPEFSHATGEVASDIKMRGRYGEGIKATVGLVVNSGRGSVSEYLTRVYRWEIRSRMARAEGTSGPGEAGAPWTCVTNCTQVDITPRTPSLETLREQAERLADWLRIENEKADEIDLEARYARAETFRKARHSPIAREALAQRGIFLEPAPVEPEEYFPI